LVLLAYLLLPGVYTITIISASKKETHTFMTFSVH